MSISLQLQQITRNLPAQVRLVAVSKFHPASQLQEAYDAGQRIFGESRVQELVEKYDQLPKDIQWHFIGHLQVNKVKYIAPFIDTIHSVDSEKVLNEIDKYAGKFNRKIRVLLQIHIAKEEHKFGFYTDEMGDFLKKEYPNVLISGVMGMATFTDDEKQIRKEFKCLANCFRQLKTSYFSESDSFTEISMGMSDDYPIAIEEGSTMIRVGSKIFGNRF